MEDGKEIDVESGTRISKIEPEDAEEVIIIQQHEDGSVGEAHQDEDGRQTTLLNIVELQPDGTSTCTLHQLSYTTNTDGNLCINTIEENGQRKITIESPDGEYQEAILEEVEEIHMIAHDQEQEMVHEAEGEEEEDEEEGETIVMQVAEDEEDEEQMDEDENSKVFQSEGNETEEEELGEDEDGNLRYVLRDDDSQDYEVKPRAKKAKKEVEELFFCGFCDRSFKTNAGLVRHLTVVHAKEEKDDDPLNFELCGCCGDPLDGAHLVRSRNIKNL